ncbi:hypothetical protein F2Q70_00013424 [Brassica cretica]|uniref:Uncharacterized protein n=1 Tax=Brassica cretica TaxID=69181 RepID=A0A8S9M8F4_BRACR|nr:hypothetical protein F2Q70_00013424 [Brassica cretica]
MSDFRSSIPQRNLWLIRKLNLSRYWSSMPMSLILLHIKLNAFAKPKSVTCPVLSATESYSGVSYPLHVPGGANDYPGDDVSGAQSVTEKLSDLAQNGVPVNNNQCDSGQ